ncbi:MAG TPA: ankyrin repeat domain-containing protein [Caulobacteraceae bacterium]|jgi:ankyrin repeat protein
MLDRIRTGRCDLVFEHLAGGGSPDAPDEAGVPLIRWCAYYGDVSAVRKLLEAGATLASLGPNLDLNGAAFHGYWRLCQFLIEQGADPNHPLPETGETPLHAALCRVGGPAAERVLAVLLGAGADPNVATTAGAETGCFTRDSRTRGETPLHRAAAFGCAETVQRLLEAGASREARDAHGDTPLAWASWHLRPAEIVRKLCYDGHALHPAAHWTGDHGAGWSRMEINLLGEPHPEPRSATFS